MVTVSESARLIIERSRYLSEALSKNLINISSLARYIKPEIEEMLLKNVSESSVIMALKRLEGNFTPKYHFKNIFSAPPEIIVRSNISFLNIPATIFDSLNIPGIITSTRTATEVTCLISGVIEQHELKKMGQEIVYVPHLSSIGIRLPHDAITTPGIFYFFLKSIAWEGINIIEIVSTTNEFTLLFEDKEVQRAFSIIKSLFSNKAFT